MSTPETTVIASSTPCTAFHTSLTASTATSCHFVATASSLTVPIAASTSLTSPTHIDSTVLTNSVRVLSSAALAPTHESSSSVIEALLSQPVVSFVDSESDSEEVGVIPQSSATAASHSPFIVASPPSSGSSPISLEDLLSRCLPEQSAGSGESSGSRSMASCDSSPSAIELMLSHAAPELTSLQNNTDANEERPEDDQTSF